MTRENKYTGSKCIDESCWKHKRSKNGAPRFGG